jgi:hypothetical protein
MTGFDAIIEAKIAEAQRAGAFDNLVIYPIGWLSLNSR